MKRILFLLFGLVCWDAAHAQLPARIPYREGQLWGFCDSTARVLIAPQYDHVDFFDGPVTRVSKDKKYGVIDSLGNTLIPLNFYSVAIASHIITTFDGKEERLFNLKGQPLNNRAYDKAEYPQNGSCFVMKNGKYGLVDSTGREIIPVGQFNITNVDLSYAYNGHGLVRVHMKSATGYGCALIDKSGKLLDTRPYLDIDDFYQGGQFTRAYRGFKTTHYTDMSGNVVDDRDPLYGVINSKGKEVVPCQYTQVNFDERGITVQGKTGWGLFDGEGKQLFPFRFRTIEYALPGMYVLENDSLFPPPLRPGDPDDSQHGHCALADIHGNLLTPFRYTGIGRFSHGIAKVRIGQKWGYIDSTGREIVPVKYDNVSDFGFLIGSVCTGRYEDKTIACTVVDHNGKPFLPNVCSRYEWISEYYGYLLVERNKHRGYIDKNGKELVPPVWSQVRRLVVGYCEVEDSTNRYGIVDTLGHVILPCIYQDVDNISLKNYVIVSIDTTRYNRKPGTLFIGGTKKGLYSTSGKLILPAEFETLTIRDSLVFTTRKVILTHDPGMVKPPDMTSEDRILEPVLVSPAGNGYPGDPHSEAAIVRQYPLIVTKKQMWNLNGKELPLDEPRMTSQPGQYKGLLSTYKNNQWYYMNANGTRYWKD